METVLGVLVVLVVLGAVVDLVLSKKPKSVVEAVKDIEPALQEIKTAAAEIKPIVVAVKTEVADVKSEVVSVLPVSGSK